ncbi:MAG: hypothetical protein HY895_09265 [Deltaproteobacteria bacterium]|nr:hypothetical protein [Deltaproteobacteria bacterium]
MNQMKMGANVGKLFTLAMILMVLAACQSMDKGDTKKVEAQKRLPDVREFEDVLVPRDMLVDRDASFVYRGAGQPMGLLRLSGRVDATSLMRFFKTNLPNDGWQLVSELRGPQSLLMYQKARRLCLILIEDASFQTFADVWVVPANDSVDTGIRK